MPKHLEIQRNFFSIILVIVSMGILITWPVLSRPASILILLTSIGMAITVTAQKCWQDYQQAECTREKMIRNLALDLLGLLLTMGAAMYIGRLAGGYFGIRAGSWIGLFAGFLSGFLAAWLVRSIWGRLVTLA